MIKGMMIKHEGRDIIIDFANASNSDNFNLRVICRDSPQFAFEIKLDRTYKGDVPLQYIIYPPNQSVPEWMKKKIPEINTHLKAFYK